MKQSLLSLLLLCLLINASAQTIIGRQSVDQFPVNSSGTLTYGLAWVPTTYASTTRTYPLIIFLHGAGETGTTQNDLSRLNGTGLPNRIANGWNAVAVNPRTGVQDSFIVISPQAPSWSYSYNELRYILPSILSKYRIDRSRIYLTGLSAGGGGTFTTFGSRDSLFIKNFAAMATASSAGTNNTSNGYTAVQVEAGLRYGSTYGVRMWTVAGDFDYLLTTDVRYHDSTNKANPAPANKLTVLSGVGHSAWNQMYNPSFRPTINYYGNSGTCNNGCAFGGVPVAPNTNGSTVRGSGITQDSLNLYEWFLLAQRTDVTTPNIGDYRSNASKPAGGKWSIAANWQRFNGAAWVTSTAVPTTTSGIITIKNNDSLEVDIALNADGVIVAPGGILSVQTGSLTLANGIGNDLIVNGTLHLGNLQSISGAGTIEINGIFNWHSGTLSSVTEAKNAAEVNLLSNNNKNLGANFNNRGTLNWYSGVSAGDLILTNAAFTNNGVVNEEFQSNRGFARIGGTSTILNAGTLRKKSTNALANNSVPFNNTGTLQGIGIYNFNVGTISNSGTVRPGNSPGILTINGAALTGQNTTVKIEIFNGSGAGAGHNRLDLTGDMSLNGNDLIVTELPGVPSQSYTVLTTTGVFTGSFQDVSLPAGYSLSQTASAVIVTKFSATLPAVWGEFTAIHKNGNVVLNWSTLQEQNTSHFAVEYSTNGRDFIEMATVKAAGNSGLVLPYRFEHKKASSSTGNFYRIKLYDLDGKASQSSVRVVKFAKEHVILVQALPNPMINQLQLQVQENVTIQLVDVTGRLHLTQQTSAGIHYLNVQGLHKGMYQLLVLKDNRIIETHKLIK